MTDYWISGAKYWCEDCKKYISDNKASRKHHESGATHQTNRKKRLEDIRKKHFEQNKETTELDREFQRINKEAIHQQYQDLAQLGKSQSESSSPPPPDGFFDPDSQHPPANPAGVGQGDWSYFDEEMIAAQRKRLYGTSGNTGNTGNGNSENSENSDLKPEPPKKPYRRRRAPLKDQDEEETNEGDEDNGGGDDHGPTSDEPYDPDVPSDEEKKISQKVSRETAGIAGAYKEVDPSSLYNQYYRLSTEPEDQPNSGEDNPAEEDDPFRQSEISNKRKTKEISDDEEDDWVATVGRSVTTVYQERQMEKTLSETLEEGTSPVVWKKPKVGANKRGRRKR